MPPNDHEHGLVAYRYMWLLLVPYYAAGAFLSLLAMYRLVLTVLYLRRPDTRSAPGLAELPQVTVQLPLFNEALVATRLINAACSLDYPAHRLQIQVLDDSTDHTTAMVAALVETWSQRGVQVEHVRREERTGFKAGALQAAMSAASGEFIAIFDADFVPQHDFLQRALSAFDSPQVGMVQTRWGHLNRGHSLLTRAQAVLLDGHFVVEQTARAAHGRFMNFNGTAGVWRAEAIRDAGGWSHDTLTEDLDLSYRAQLRGWRFVYLVDVESPGEIPPDLSGFKSQQYRWAKGSIECLTKLAPAVLRADRSLLVRGEGLLHLMANMGYVAVMVLVLTLPFVASFRTRVELPLTVWLDTLLFASGALSLLTFYGVSSRATGSRWYDGLATALWAMMVDVGMSLHKSRAVIDALRRRRTAFVRTPKHGQTATSHTTLPNPYVRPAWRDGLPELAVTGWCTAALVALLQNPWQSPVPLAFLGFFALSFGTIGVMAVLDRLRLARA